MPVDDGFNRDEQGRIIAAPMTAKFLIDYLRRQGCSIVTHEELAEERREIEEEAEDAREYLACTDCGVEAGDAYISRTPFGDHANRCISCENAYFDYVNKHGQ